MSEELYTLKDAFKYADKSGDQVEASFVALYAPNFKQIDKATPLKQMLARAIKEIQSDEDVAEAAKEAREAVSDEESNITASQVIQLLYASSEDATKALLYAAELFKSGAALLDGEVKVTDGILKEKMSLRDFEGLVGAYMVNFIVPSLTGGD